MYIVYYVSVLSVAMLCSIQNSVYTILYTVYCTLYSSVHCIHYIHYIIVYSIVNAGKTAHFLLNFTLDKIRLAQIMDNRVYFVRNTCYFDIDHEQKVDIIIKLFLRQRFE